MARFLTILGIVVVASVAAAAAAVFLIPVDVYRGQIEAAAKTATGREMTIAGGLGMTLFPTIGIRAEQVTFQNAPSGKAPRMAEMDSLVVGVDLLPLLGGDLRITDLVLERPVINLEISKSGKPNWEFETQGTAPAGDTPAGGGAPTTGVGGVSNLSFGDVRIIDGTLTYSDLKAGTTETIEAINVSIALPSLDDPLAADGSLAYKGETLTLDATAEKPRALMEGGTTPIAFALASRLVDATFNGSVDAGDAALDGALSLTADSVRDLATWLGTALPKGEGFQALSLKGALASAGSRADFKNLALSFDGMTGTGALALDTSGAVPLITGALEFDRLDLNPYLADSGEAGGTASSAPLGGSSGGGTGGGRWSSEPIDASGLKAINADLRFTVGEFHVQKIHMGKSLLTLLLKNGVLTANLKELDLYEGSGAGVFIVDASRGAPTVRTRMTLDAIQALPLLTDAAEMSWLEGLGTVTLDVAGTGISQAAIMRSLTGSGAINFVEGSIRGVNLAEIARNIDGALTGTAIGESAKTDFAQLGGTFKITNGVLTNTDLSLLNPFVRMLGNGAIDIGAQTMKYRIEPRAVSSIEGQGGQGDLAGVGIPFLISGPWNNLSFAPDLEGLANQAIQDALSGKGIQLPGLPGLGGQQPAEGEGGAGEETKPASPIDLLPGLLGGQKPAAEEPAAEEPAEEKPAEEEPLIPGFPGLTR